MGMKEQRDGCMGAKGKVNLGINASVQGRPGPVLSNETDTPRDKKWNKICLIHLLQSIVKYAHCRRRITQ